MLTLPTYPDLKSEAELMASWSGNVDVPVVSILCATYNHASYIEDAIIGFLFQDTGFPFEIIIVDDASTDATKEIVAKYASNYPRIVKPIFHSQNQYSQGLRPPRYFKDYIKGRYCALCEGDDYWIDPNKLRLQVAGLERNAGVDFSIHPAYMLDMEKKKMTLMFEHGTCETILPVNAAVASLSQFSPTASYVFRSEAFFAMPDWFFEARDLPFGDYFLESIIGRSGILYFPEPLSVYRRNVPGSYTSTTKLAEEAQLLKRLQSILVYTRSLSVFTEIPQSALETRLKMVFLDYTNMAVSRNSHAMMKTAVDIASRCSVSIDKYERLLGSSRIFFSLYVMLKVTKRIVRKLIRG